MKFDFIERDLCVRILAVEEGMASNGLVDSFLEASGTDINNYCNVFYDYLCFGLSAIMIIFPMPIVNPIKYARRLNINSSF